VVRPLDTSVDAEQLQADVYARMDGGRRVELAIEMSMAMRVIAADGIRARHPEYADSEVRHALHRLLLGDALFLAAWPDAPLLAP
jgi:hypothetical protein